MSASDTAALNLIMDYKQVLQDALDDGEQCPNCLCVADASGICNCIKDCDEYIVANT